MTTRTFTPAATSRLRAFSWPLPPMAVRQVLAFAAIGAVSTAAYVALYALLREAVPATAANGAALVATAIGNTAANRRLTFRVQGRHRLARDHAAGLIALGIALAITSASLAVLGRAAPGAAREAELAVLVGANGVATLVRFLLLRRALGRGPMRRRTEVERLEPAAALPAAARSPAMTQPSRLEGTPR